MIGSLWRRHRGAILLGLLGFAALAALLVFAVLAVAAMGHCSQCDRSPLVLRGLAASMLVASVFGIATGLAAAVLRPLLRAFLGAGPATALLILLTLGLAVAAWQPGFAAVDFLQHRAEWAREKARLAEPRELCPDRSRHLAIIHDALPRPLPRDTFVAEVRFEGTDVAALHLGGASARVRRVIQGDPAIRRLTVERLQSDRCDKAFENGREGLVVVIPRELPRGDGQKVEAIFVRRADGFRLPDGFQIQEWQRPYWLAPPKPAVADGRRGRSVTHAGNGIATTAIDGGPAIAVRAAPARGSAEAQEAPGR
ncbi:MAG TPA: hypothetical protein VF718_06855 [Allosphingosinicella sp.]|jgi:hypothetical protein